MFFRKKRYGDVEGYDRISRLIEDRQSEGLVDEGDDDLFEEETVLLSRETRDNAPRDTFNEPAPALATRATDDEPVMESVTMVRPSELAAARATPASAPLSAPPVMPDPAPIFTPPVETPRIPLPDLSLMSSQAGAASLIAKDAMWEGKLSCSGNVRIEGTLRGEIETTATVFVAAEASVDGSIRARSVTLAGEVKGDIICEERLEILSGGAARGQVNTGALVVHEGAFIESRFQMRREGAAV